LRARIANPRYRSREEFRPIRAIELQIRAIWNIETETVYLLTIYDKGEKADLKPNELKIMIESLGLE
jgi:hypothetical protein